MLDLDLVDRHFEAIVDAPSIDALIDALEDAALDELAAEPLDAGGGGIAWALRPALQRVGQSLHPERGLRGLPSSLDTDTLQKVLDWLSPRVRRALLPVSAPSRAWVRTHEPDWLERPLTDVVLATRPALLDRHWSGIPVHTLGSAWLLPSGGVGSELTKMSQYLPPDLGRCIAAYVAEQQRRGLDHATLALGLRSGPARPEDLDRFRALYERWAAEVDLHGAAGLLDTSDLTAHIDASTGAVEVRKSTELIATWLPHGPLGAPALTASDRGRDAAAVVLCLLRRRHGRATQLATAIDTDPGTLLLTLLDRHLAEAPAPDTAMGWVLHAESLQLEPVAAELDPKGQWVPRASKVPIDQLDATDDDRRAMRAHELHTRTRGIDPTHRLAALRALVGHPRVFTPTGDRIAIRQPTAELVLKKQGTSMQTRWRVGEHIVGSDDARDWLVGGDGRHGLWWSSPTDLHLVDFRLAAPIVEVLRRAGDHIPPSAVDGFLERLPGIAHRTPMEVDPELAQEERPADPQPHLRLSVSPTHDLHVQIVVFPAGPSGGFTPPGVGPPHRFGTEPIRFVVHRDRTKEVARASSLAGQLGLRRFPQIDFVWEKLELGDAVDVLKRLSDMPDIPVHWLTGTLTVHSASSGHLDLRVRQKGRWFSLDGELKTPKGAIPLREVLAQLRQGRAVIVLGHDEVIQLTKELRDTLIALSASTEPAADGERLSLGATPMLSELLSVGIKTRLPAGVHERLQRVQEVPADLPLPQGLNATLRPYQAEGVQWLMHRAAWAPGACLADDMGLGKTVQALGLLLHRANEGPALVVAPTSTLRNWAREAERFAPSLTIRVAHGAGRDEAIAQCTDADVMLTTWGTLVRSVDALAARRFATVVLDEAQAIKNSTTQRAQAVRQLQTDFLLALTGTPVENAAHELWALFDALSPGLLGTAKAFHLQFSVPLSEAPRHDVARELRARIRPLLLRRTKAQVLPQLPPRTDIVVPVALSPEERRRYEEVRGSALAAFADKKAKKDRARVLAALTRLRQLASHPRLVDPQAPATSAKLSAARRTLLELHASGQQALVFSQFTKLLDLFQASLQGTGLRMGRIDGSHTPDQRQASVDGFQAHHTDVLLLSLHAAGTGLTLTAARTVMHLDAWWNPSVQDQATDRAHRIGQEHAVTVLHFVAEDTVDEGIRALQSQKRTMVDSLLEGHHQAQRLTGEALMGLIRDGGIDAPVADAKRAVAHILGPDHPWPLEEMPADLAEDYERWVQSATATRGPGAAPQLRAVHSLFVWALAAGRAVGRDELEGLARGFAGAVEAGGVPAAQRAGERAVKGVRRWLSSGL